LVEDESTLSVAAGASALSATVGKQASATITLVTARRITLQAPHDRTWQ
jgi:hypothetical protein